MVVTIEAKDGKKIEATAKPMPGLWRLAELEFGESVHFRFEQVSNH
jgi:hypothetical protein